MQIIEPNNAGLSGRNFEERKLQSFVQRNNSDLVSIIGRRRVGKTFLIKQVYQKNLLFHMTGIRDATKQEQLANFADTLAEHHGLTATMETPKNWPAAFKLLKELVNKKRTKLKKVIFLDEFPWMASPRSGFLQAFDHFWNAWAVDQNLIVVICGSAATWMINRIVDEKGGLHNRVTERITLDPFTLAETEQYFKDRKINMPRYDIISIYMALGGIPYYLKNIQKGDTAITAIDRILFGRKAALKGEFDNLYQALFTNYQDHIQVIKVLADKRKGLTRKQILKQTTLSSGGGFTLILRELEESSFISSYEPFLKIERDTMYRLTDEYSLFYLHFIENQKTPKGTWLKKATSPSVRSWSGYTFESICFKHIESIKKSMGIDGVLTFESSFLYHKKNNMPGFQIDMLIDRADNAINICEAKFYNTEYVLTAEELKKLRLKKAYFEAVTKTKKQVITTLMTTYGLANPQMAEGVDVEMKMDALFNAEN